MKNQTETRKLTTKNTRGKLWVDIYQEGNDFISIVKEGCRLRHEGELLHLKGKQISVKTMRRVAETVEGVKGSNALYQNKYRNDK